MKPSRILRTVLAVGLAAIGLATTALAQDNKLKIITWADYVPADVVAQFKKETGIDVELTLSNNEEMIPSRPLPAVPGSTLRSHRQAASPDRRRQSATTT